MTDAQRNEQVRALVVSCGLSPRESTILRLLLDGVPRSRLHLEMCVSENTIKSQVRALLKRTGQRNVDELVWLLRQNAGPYAGPYQPDLAIASPR